MNVIEIGTTDLMISQGKETLEPENIVDYFEAGNSRHKYIYVVQKQPQLKLDSRKKSNAFEFSERIAQYE